MANRSLGSTFLATVLGDRRFYRLIPVNHVEIRGAYFPDTVELRNLSTPFGLGIVGSRFESNLEMINFSSAGNVSFTRTVFAGDLEMRSSSVKEIILSHVSAQRIGLMHAKVDAAIHLSKSTIRRTLELSVARVGQVVSIRKSDIGSVNAMGIHVADQFSFVDSTVQGRVGLEGSILDEFVIAESTMENVALTDAKVTKTVSLRDSRISGTYSVNRARVGSEMFVWTSEIVNCMDFTSTEIGGSVKLSDSNFGQLTGSTSKIAGKFEVERVEVRDLFDLKGLHVEGIFGVAESIFPDFDVSVGGFGAQFVVQDSTVEGEAKLNSIDVYASLFLRRSQIGEIDLLGSKIGGRLAVIDSEVLGNLELQSANVDGDLVLTNSNVVGEIDIQVAEISGYVLFDGLSNTAAVGLQGLTSGGGILFENSSLPYIDLSRTTTPANIGFRSSKLGFLNLTAATAGQSITFGGSHENRLSWGQIVLQDRLTKFSSARVLDPHLSTAGLLILQDARMVDLEFDRGSFPTALELDGIQLTRLSPVGDPNLKMQSDWLASWLERDPTYSPSPYTAVASALRAGGDEGLADDILVLRRDRERDAVNLSDPRWWGWTTAKYLIGYGYGWGTFRALYWVGGLSVLGTLVLLVSGNRRKSGLKLGFWYSLDLLIPGIRLRQQHYDSVELTGWANYYFYIHSILGYVLLLFVLAGLSGLVQ